MIVLSVIEHADILKRDDIIEALLEGVDLLVDGMSQFVRAHQSHVLTLVVVGDGNVTAIGFQIYNADSSKFIRSVDSKYEQIGTKKKTRAENLGVWLRC